jgi:hypothetical protein
MCYCYLGDRTLGRLRSVPLGDEVLMVDVMCEDRLHGYDLARALPAALRVE